MDRFRLLARATLRRRWRSVVAAGLLAGFVGGGLLMTISVARRTSTAFARLADETRLEDVRVSSFYGRQNAEAVADLAQVEEAWLGTAMVAQLEGDTLRYISMRAGPDRSADLHRPLLVEGRRADPDAFDEAVIDSRLAEGAGLEVGDEIDLDLLTTDEFLNFDEGFGDPDGPEVTLRVVGVTNVPDSEGSALLEATPAFNERYASQVRSADGRELLDVLVRLRDRAEQDEFQADVNEIGRTGQDAPDEAAEIEAFHVVDPRIAAEPVDAAARVVVVGLMIGLGIGALAGGTAVVQVLIRRHALDEPVRAIESALGMTFRDQLLARAVTGLPAAVVAAAVAAVIATASSGLGPPGSLSAIDPDIGLTPHWIVIGLGALAVLALTSALDLVAFSVVARTRTRRRAPAPRRSLVAALTSTSAPVLDVGVDLAFDRRGGRAAIAARSARIGAIVGVAGILASFVYAGSLDRLASTPMRWGWEADAVVADVQDETVELLLADDRVEALSDSRGRIVELGGQAVTAYSFEMRRGSLGWTVLEGRLPTSPDEVLLGERVARREALELGDRLTVVGERFTGEAAPRQREVTVVGRGVGPGKYEDFGDDLVLTSDAFDGSSGALVAGSYREAYLGLEPGTFDEFMAERGTGLEIDGPRRPDEVENLASLSALPYVLGGFLAIIGLAALANALVVIGSQRRRELGALRALGMTRRGVRLSLCVAGLAITALGVVIGAPVGVIIGSTVWRAVASSAYVDGEPLLSPWLIVVPVIAVLLVGAMVSLLAGVRANRGALGGALRSE